MSDKHSHKPKGTAAQAADGSDTDHVYTLPVLAERLGASTEEQVLVYVHSFDKTALTHEGTRVGTSKIDTDAARMYGIASDFLAKATVQQLDLLAAVDPHMLRSAVWAAQHGSLKNAALSVGSKARSGSKDVRDAAAKEARTNGLKRRTMLRTNLESLVGGDAVWLKKIAGTAGSPAKPKTLDEQITDLTKVGRQMLKSSDAAIQARLKTSRLSEAMLAGADAVAADVKAKTEAADAVAAASSVTQAEVDYWDGINLYLIGTFMDVFDAAHEVDPTIPRLLPNTLRGYFGRRSYGGTADAAPPDGQPAAADAKAEDGANAAAGAAKKPA